MSLPQKAISGPDSDRENLVVPDSEKKDTISHRPGLVSIVRFLKDYTTQEPLAEDPNKFRDRIYRREDVATQESWKARDLAARDIVTIINENLGGLKK